jgi:hypothetical protein
MQIKYQRQKSWEKTGKSREKIYYSREKIAIFAEKYGDEK